MLMMRRDGPSREKLHLKCFLIGVCCADGRGEETRSTSGHACVRQKHV